MKFTWKWLLDHLETDRKLTEILETLPKLGLEVASVINLAEDLKNFISSFLPSVSVIFIANPNNPTGTYLSFREIKNFLQKID